MNNMAWPAFVFGLLAIVLLTGIIFSKKCFTDSNRPWVFAFVLLLSMVWFLMIYWFCVTRYHSLGWFFLLLPIVLFVTWVMSYWLASATTCPHNVANGKGFTDSQGAFMWTF